MPFAARPACRLPCIHSALSSDWPRDLASSEKEGMWDIKISHCLNWQVLRGTQDALQSSKVYGLGLRHELEWPISDQLETIFYAILCIWYVVRSSSRRLFSNRLIVHWPDVLLLYHKFSYTPSGQWAEQKGGSLLELKDRGTEEAITWATNSSCFHFVKFWLCRICFYPCLAPTTRLLILRNLICASEHRILHIVIIVLVSTLLLSLRDFLALLRRPSLSPLVKSFESDDIITQLSILF